MGAVGSLQHSPGGADFHLNASSSNVLSNRFEPLRTDVQPFQVKINLVDYRAVKDGANLLLQGPGIRGTVEEQAGTRFAPVVATAVARTGGVGPPAVPHSRRTGRILPVSVCRAILFAATPGVSRGTTVGGTAMPWALRLGPPAVPYSTLTPVFRAAMGRTIPCPTIPDAHGKTSE